MYHAYATTRVCRLLWQIIERSQLVQLQLMSSRAFRCAQWTQTKCTRNSVGFCCITFLPLSEPFVYFCHCLVATTFALAPGTLQFLGHGRAMVHFFIVSYSCLHRSSQLLLLFGAELRMHILLSKRFLVAKHKLTTPSKLLKFYIPLPYTKLWATFWNVSG